MVNTLTTPTYIKEIQEIQEILKRNGFYSKYTPEEMSPNGFTNIIEFK